MKSSMAAGPSGVVADMMKAAGEVGTKWMTDVCNAVVRDGKIPEDWSKSWLVNVYKNKGDALASVLFSSTMTKTKYSLTKIIKFSLTRRK